MAAEFLNIILFGGFRLRRGDLPVGGFGLDSHELSLFDLIINTAKITPADAADLVIKALEKLPKAK